MSGDNTNDQFTEQSTPDQGQLADLDSPGGGYDFTSFTYPVDLGANPQLSHYVIFYINESSNTQFQSATKSVAQGTQPKNPISQVIGAYSPDSTINENIKNDKSVNKVGEPTPRNTVRSHTAIVLYMPPNIATSYNADWGKEDLGFAGSVFKSFKGSNFKSLSSLADAFGDTLRGGAQSIGKNLLEEASGFTNTNIKDTASLAIRAAVNPHAETIFHGINFRSFQFDFKFTPRTDDESVAVDNIIQAFKFYAAPEINQGKSGPYFIYPAEFDIKFVSNNKENQFLNKISTCALTSININYTANGMFSTFKPGKINGVTVDTNLTLSFVELELMTKARILQGY
jgi:hypothetical protein